jgi:hypothetical protein
MRRKCDCRPGLAAGGISNCAASQLWSEETPWHSIAKNPGWMAICGGFDGVLLERLQAFPEPSFRHWRRTAWCALMRGAQQPRAIGRCAGEGALLVTEQCGRGAVAVQGGAVHLDELSRHQLAQLAATGCLNQTRYASAESQLATVRSLAQTVDTAFVAKTAVYARQAGHMKDMPALLSATLAQCAMWHCLARCSAAWSTTARCCATSCRSCEVAR